MIIVSMLIFDPDSTQGFVAFRSVCSIVRIKRCAI